VPVHAALSVTNLRILSVRDHQTTPTPLQAETKKPETTNLLLHDILDFPTNALGSISA